MAKTQRLKTSADVREEGNVLYKSGKFEEAAAKYREAIELDANDPAPLRTLSSALFEMGEHEKAMEVIEKALAIETDGSKRRGLEERRFKCAFYLREWKMVIKLAQGMVLGKEMEELVEVVRQKLKTDGPGWRELMEIPRQRPLGGPREYFTQGNDTPRTAYTTAELLEMKKKEGAIDLSVLYAGIGDGRHFVQQLIHFEDYFCKAYGTKGNHTKAKRPNNSGCESGPEKDKFEFILQDIKPHSLARNVIILRLLNEIAKLQEKIPTTKETQTEIEELEVVASYVHMCEIMPAWVHKRLKGLLKILISDAAPDKDGNHHFGMEWLLVDVESAKEIREVLEYWFDDEHGLLASFDLHSVYHGAPCISEDRIEEDYLETEGGPYQLEELDQFYATRVMYPPIQFQISKEPEIRRILSKTNIFGDLADNEQKSMELARYAVRNWKTNVTTIAEPECYTWQRGFLEKPLGRGLHIGMTTQDIFYVHTPKYIDILGDRRMDQMRAFGHDAGLIEWCKSWFQLASRAFINTPVKLQVVIRLDEIQHQLDEHAVTSKRFDAIYLSNIPDYLGGHISALIYALPLLKESNRNAYVQYNFLFNNLLFPNGLSDTMAEFLCLPTREVAKDLFGLEFKKLPDLMEGYAQQDPRDPESMASLLATPHRWMANSQDHISKLPTKVWFTRWLAQIFLKMLAPVFRNYEKKESGSFTLKGIEQPTTMYTFFRLLNLLSTRGIPSHWLSQFLSPILETGKLTTATIVPFVAPFPASKAINPFWPSTRPAPPSQTYNLCPYLAELRSLSSISKSVLPFLTTVSTSIPASTSLRRCFLEAEIYSPGIGHWMQVLTLIFINPAIIKWSQVYKEQWIRDQLVNGPLKENNPEISENMVLVGGFKWTHKECTNAFFAVPKRVGIAEWIMDEKDLKKMKGWRMGLIRTDRWSFCSDEHGFDEIKIKKWL